MMKLITLLLIFSLSTSLIIAKDKVDIKINIKAEKNNFVDLQTSSEEKLVLSQTNKYVLDLAALTIGTHGGKSSYNYAPGFKIEAHVTDMKGVMAPGFGPRNNVLISFGYRNAFPEEFVVTGPDEGRIGCKKTGIHTNGPTQILDTALTTSLYDIHDETKILVCLKQSEVNKILSGVPDGYYGTRRIFITTILNT